MRITHPLPRRVLPLMTLLLLSAACSRDEVKASVATGPALTSTVEDSLIGVDSTWDTFSAQVITTMSGPSEGFPLPQNIVRDTTFLERTLEQDGAWVTRVTHVPSEMFVAPQGAPAPTQALAYTEQHGEGPIVPYRADGSPLSMTFVDSLPRPDDLPDVSSPSDTLPPFPAIPTRTEGGAALRADASAPAPASRHWADRYIVTSASRARTRERLEREFGGQGLRREGTDLFVRTTPFGRMESVLDRARGVIAERTLVAPNGLRIRTTNEYRRVREGVLALARERSEIQLPGSRLPAQVIETEYRNITTRKRRS